MSPELKDLISASDILGAEMHRIDLRRYELDKQIAQLSCPFKAGDRIRTADGLGAKNGLEVSEVIPPVTPRDGNRWLMKCFALTKDGKVSARVVGLEEWQREFDKPILMESK